MLYIFSDEFTFPKPTDWNKNVFWSCLLKVPPCVGIKERFLGPGDWGRQHTPGHEEEWGSPQSENWSLTADVGGFFTKRWHLYVHVNCKENSVCWDLSHPAGIASHIPQAFLGERISSVLSLGLRFQCLLEGGAASGHNSMRRKGLSLSHLRNTHSPIISMYLCCSICSKSWFKDEPKLK